MPEEMTVNSCLAEIIREAGYDPRSYSGRGMYGRECLAFTCRSPFKAGAEVAETAATFTIPEELAELLPEEFLADVVGLCQAACVDSMGRDTVIYFPSIEWDEAWC